MINKIHFLKEEPNLFYHTLKARVNEFIKNENKITFVPAIKSILLISMYAIFVYLVFTGNNKFEIIFSYMMMGVMTIGIFLNVVHDAAHNSLFKKAIYNKLFIHLLEIFGTDAYIWKKRHIVSHHSYPNILGKDYDIRQSSLLRIVPNSPFLAHHCYQ